MTYTYNFDNKNVECVEITTRRMSRETGGRIFFVEIFFHSGDYASWESQYISLNDGSPVIDDEGQRIYSTYYCYITCHDIHTGKLLWTKEYNASKITMIENTLSCCNFDSVFTVNCDNGKLIKRMPSTAVLSSVYLGDALFIILVKDEWRIMKMPAFEVVYSFPYRKIPIKFEQMRKFEYIKLKDEILEIELYSPFIGVKHKPFYVDLIPFKVKRD